SQRSPRPRPILGRSSVKRRTSSPRRKNTSSGIRRPPVRGTGRYQRDGRESKRGETVSEVASAAGTEARLAEVAGELRVPVRRVLRIHRQLGEARGDHPHPTEEIGAGTDAEAQVRLGVGQGPGEAHCAGGLDV